DKLLCHIYLYISQNPDIGIRQSKDQFWSRIEEAYNLNKPDNLQIRNKRSLQCRMRNILHDISKLTGCVSQIEALRPSGAFEEDILNRAKVLLMQDTEFRKGFKFHHVWPIMKDFVKFSSDSNPSKTQTKMRETNLDSSQSDLSLPHTPTSGSTGLPSFEINLSSDVTSAGSAWMSAGSVWASPTGSGWTSSRLNTVRSYQLESDLLHFKFKFNISLCPSRISLDVYWISLGVPTGSAWTSSRLNTVRSYQLVSDLLDSLKTDSPRTSASKDQATRGVCFPGYNDGTEQLTESTRLR
ncbi:hypothetical protein F511_11061, partial [Dorcoceras hygrometricum]